MFENYTNKATKYADEQRNIAINGNVKANTTISSTPTHTSPTNSIPPNQYVNGTFHTNQESNGNTLINIYPHNTDNTKGVFYEIFNKSNIILLLWFLAVYFIAYFILGFLFNKNEDTGNYQLRLSRTIDIISLFCLLVIVISTYASYTDEQKEHIVSSTFSSTSNFINDPMSIFSTLFFIIIFYVVVYLFRLPMDHETKPIILSLIESIIWILFVLILFNDFFKYILGISFTNMLSKFFNWSSLPSDNGISLHYGNVVAKGNVFSITNVSSTGSDYIRGDAYKNTYLKGNVFVGGNVAGNTITSQPVQQDEVFNISNNLYTYDDAQSICSSYGAKLANYDQIEDAYSKGGEWCNYGWSDGQMAFFPTQKSTWQELQKDPKHKNDCGRPGVNGGYFANPYVKFGVNCYGKKPNPTPADLDRMKKQKQQDKIQPKTTKDSVLDKKVQFWKDNADKLLVINSHNKDHWSEY